MLQLKLALILTLGLAWTPSVWSVCDTLGHVDSTVSMSIQFFGNRATKPHSNQADYESSCKSMESAIDTMNTYAGKCLETQAAMFAKTVLASVKDHNLKWCKDKANSAEFIEHSKCFDDPAILEQFHGCFDQWYHRMQALSKLPGEPDLELGIRSSCCIFHEFQRCVRQLNVKLCHDENAQFWDDVLGDVSGESVDLLCADLKTDTNCDANFPRDTWGLINNPVIAIDATALKSRPGKFQSTIINILDMLTQYTLKP